MKLLDLLDPSLPLPWGDVAVAPDDRVEAEAILLQDGAFATELVLPIGDGVQTCSAKLVEMVALRAHQIVVHVEGRRPTLHYVAAEVMGEIPVLVKTSDFVLRLNPDNRMSPAAVFAQLFLAWKDAEINRHTIVTLVRDTEIAPMTEADEALALEAIDILVRAERLTRQAVSLRGEAVECMIQVHQKARPI